MTTAPSDAELSLFENLVHKRSGIMLRTRRVDLSEHVINLMEETRAQSPRDLYALMQSQPTGHQLQDKLVESLTVSETHFFRNRPQIEALEQHILPELIRRNRESRTLRIWSAGCATGEEPYTIAMLLHRLLPDLAMWKISLLASDLNASSLEKAREGLYGAWSFRQIPDHYKECYFTPDGRKFRIASHIVSMVHFVRMNLVEPSYPSLAGATASLDLILCRNVFIYFDEATTQAIVHRFHQSLAERGWLVVGHAEPSQKIFAAFATRDFPGAVLYQKCSTADSSFDVDHRNIPVAWTAPALDAPLPESNRSPATHTEPPRVRADSKSKSSVDELLAEVEALIAGRRHAQALVALEAIHVTYPKLAQACYLSARVHAVQAHWREAAASIEQAVKLAPLNASAHYLQGLILKESDDFGGAVESFRHCTYLEPAHALAHYLMAVSLRHLGADARAEKTMERAASALQGLPADDAVRDGDGLTVGQLMGWVAEWRAHDGSGANSGREGRAALARGPRTGIGTLAETENKRAGHQP